MANLSTRNTPRPRRNTLKAAAASLAQEGAPLDVAWDGAVPENLWRGVVVDPKWEAENNPAIRNRFSNWLAT